MASPNHALTDLAPHYTVNVLGTKNVIAACQEAGVRRLIFTSSASVVFDGRHDIKNGDESLPYAGKATNAYGETKAQAEAIALAANAQGGLLTCALRPSNIFGPGDPDLVPITIKNAQRGKLKFIVGDGENMSDWTYVENVVHAHICAEKALSEYKGDPTSDDSPAGKVWTHSLSLSPSVSPFLSPFSSSSLSPSHSPSLSPFHSPSLTPSHSLSHSPSHSPSLSPSHSPSISHRFPHPTPHPFPIPFHIPVPVPLPARPTSPPTTCPQSRFSAASLFSKPCPPSATSLSTAFSTLIPPFSPYHFPSSHPSLPRMPTISQVPLATPVPSHLSLFPSTAFNPSPPLSTFLELLAGVFHHQR
ncbi:unnamed protein product [Closterium sp. NIES-54]